MKCKIDIEEKEECTDCCIDCKEPCEKKCVFTKKHSDIIDCDNQINE